MSGQRNADNAPVTSPDWSICAVKSLAFDGVNSGAIGTQTLFTVTGAVLLRLFGKVTSSLTATSRSPSASVSPSSSTSLSASPSASVSPSSSLSPSSSTSPSSSSSISMSPSSSISASRSPSSSVSPSASRSPSSSSSPSISASTSPSSSVSKSLSPSASISPSASLSPSSSVSPSPSPGSSGELSLGTTTNTAAFIAASEGYLFTTNKLWVDSTPTTTAELITTAPQFIVTENVALTVATAGIYGGGIDIYACFYPLGQNSNLVAA